MAELKDVCAAMRSSSAARRLHADIEGISTPVLIKAVELAKGPNEIREAVLATQSLEPSQPQKRRRVAQKRPPFLAQHVPPDARELDLVGRGQNWRRMMDCTLNTKQLRQLAREQNAPQYGTKSEVLQRLQANGVQVPGAS